MAVYFVTGKLGSGKSLVCVGMIRDYLQNSLPVATNLDLKLEKLVSPINKTAVVYRLPDKPSADDLRLIGRGNETYDESKNGLLVLDECGTWFNSRTWNDKGRQELINWFLHARKLGWDVCIIVQDINIVDKQAREALAEHVIYCKRLDRLPIPFIGFIFNLLTGGRLPFPRLHLGIVKYGDSANSSVVDRKVYRGGDIQTAYDTKQAFSSFYPHGTYTFLPPYYTRARLSYTPRDREFTMRMTKIMFKKYSRVTAFLAGAAVAFMGFQAGAHFQEKELKKIDKQLAVEQAKHPQKKTEKEDEKPSTIFDFFDGYRISAKVVDSIRGPSWTFSAHDKPSIYSETLRYEGYEFQQVSADTVRIKHGAEELVLSM